MKTCMILVDLQNDYFPGGSMELVGIGTAAANARLLLEAFRKREQPVFHIQHIAARPGATFFLPETNGARINATVAPMGDETTIVKNYPNSFRDTTLAKLLGQRKIQDLVICGAMSHMCIDATVRAAFDLGFNCTVAEDACATRNLIFNGKTINASEVHASFMAAMAGVYAEVLSTQSLIKKMA